MRYTVYDYLDHCCSFRLKKVFKQVPEVIRLWVFAVIIVVFVVRFEVVAGFVLVEDMLAVVTAVDIVLSVVIRNYSSKSSRGRVTNKDQ